jgi:hypothetical protein
VRVAADVGMVYRLERLSFCLMQENNRNNATKIVWEGKCGECKSARRKWESVDALKMIFLFV